MKNIKALAIFALLLVFLSQSVGCSGSTEVKNASVLAADTESGNSSLDAQLEGNRSDILVVYFSAQGHTKSVATRIAGYLGSDTYEIVPSEPYTQSDLAYNNSDSRVSKENRDQNVRPKISSTTPDLGSYDYIFLGYPIWFGSAPKIISTFLENTNLAGKIIIPFCTSSSSPIGNSASSLHSKASGATWQNGRVFTSSQQSDGVIRAWLEGLDLKRNTK